MTPSDKLREIVDKTFPLFGSRLDEWRKVERDMLLSDLTALISENYYPKEFVGWMLRCSAYSDVPFREFTLKWNVNIGPDEWRYFTTDELFNYWANNEK